MQKLQTDKELLSQADSFEQMISNAIDESYAKFNDKPKSNALIEVEKSDGSLKAYTLA